MIASGGGGIFGYGAGQSNGNVFAQHCYVIGSLNTNLDTCGNYVPGIFGSNPGTYDQSNCIVDTYWIAADASNTLQYNVPSNTWTTTTDTIGQASFYKLTSNPDSIPRNVSSISQTYTLTNTIPDTSINWPLTIAGGSQSTPTVLTFGSNRVFKDVNHYFIIGSNYITIDGSGCTIDISGVSAYPGLVQNGISSTSGSFSNITVQNIQTTTHGSSALTNGGGWIGQEYYGVSGQNNVIQHCSSTGLIQYTANLISGAGCGGIVGSFAAGYGGQLVVFDCSSSGTISGYQAGGIVGANSANGTSISNSNGGIVDVSKCFSTGAITGLNGPGGIFGAGAGPFGGYATATNCYSTGSIAGFQAGGIYGRGAGDNNSTDFSGSMITTPRQRAVARNCYALGQIDASYGGGIFAASAANTGGTITSFTKGSVGAYNCYYDGSINNTTAGGIVGGYPSGNSLIDASLGRVDISSCYVALTYPIVPPANTYIYGSIAGTSDLSHIYITDSSYTINGWQNNIARQCLENIGTGGSGYVWNAFGQTLTAPGGTPYTLTAFNPLPNTIPPTFGPFTIPSQTYSVDTSYTIIDPSSNSAGAFTYTSDNSGVATVSGNIITVIDVGTSTITATQAANGSFLSGTIDASFTVNKATPSFGTFIIPSKVYGDASFTITDPSSNSSGAFTYTSDNSGVATVLGNTITIVGVGSSIITATQATDRHFVERTIDTSFTVNPITQIISNKTVFDQKLIHHAYSWPVTVETSTTTPTTFVFNGPIQLTPSSTQYFIVNGQTMNMLNTSETTSSIVNTDSQPNSLFRGE